MFYLVYKITNTINGKFYIGVHKTENKEDGYMGSGLLIRRAIKKYGIEHFKKEILIECSSEKDMYDMEQKLVTICNDSYNLMCGGRGGWSFINSMGLNLICNASEEGKRRHKEGSSKGGIRGGKSTLEKKVGIHSDSWKNNSSDYFKDKYKNDLSFRENVEKNLKYMNSKECIEHKKKKFKEINHQVGEKNSQFGTCWISHPLIGSKKCKIDLLPEFIEQEWIKGRSIFKNY